MSRYVAQTEKDGKSYKIAFGVDHAIGHFVDIWDLSQGAGDDEEGLVYSKCTFFDAVTPVEMGQVMQSYNLNIAREIEKGEHHAGL